MIAMMLNMFSIVAFAENKEDGQMEHLRTTSNDMWGDNYDAETNFIISTKEELLTFASLVNAETDAKNFQNKTVTLAADIDLSDVNWVPIGQDKNNANGRTYDGNAFEGTFNGNGYTISNISIGQPGGDFLGLFGGVKGAVIKNLKIENCSINGKRGQDFFSTKGSQYDQSEIEDAGGLVGYVGVEGATISDVAVNNISVYSDRAGGSLIGWAAGALNINGVTVKDINIMGSCDRTGGLIGYVGGSEPYNVEISNVSVQGTIRLSAPKSSPWAAGGLIGMVQMPSNSNTLVIDDTSVCARIEVAEFYNESASISASGSGFIGDIRSGNIIIKDSDFTGKIAVHSNPNYSPNLGRASGFSKIENGYREKASISISNCSLLNTEISASTVNVFGGANSTALINSFADVKIDIGNGNYYIDATKEAIRDNLTFEYKNAYDWTLLPTVEPRIGYIFAWKDTNGVVHTLLKSVVEGHNTICPTWTPNTYTISFNGGSETSGIMSNILATYDQLITLPRNTFTKIEHEFLGWTTKENGTVVEYFDGSQVSNLTSEAEGNITLYAVWRKTDSLNLKEDLAALIKYAQDAKKDETYKYLVPKVKELFEKALENAIEVNNKEDATQTEVDAAYNELLAKVHLLNFTGNTESLTVLAATASGKVEEMYTKESWEPFDKALKSAQGVLADENALQAEIDAARDALQAAMDALVEKPIDTSKLEKLVAEASVYEENIENYIPSTTESFTAALDGAREVLASEKITQEAVDSAYKTLLNAIFGLREVPNKERLEDLLGKVEAMDLSAYSEESANAVKAAVAMAAAVMEDENANQEQVDAVVAALEEAVAALEAKEEAEAGDINTDDTEDTSREGDSSVTDKKVASNDGESKDTANKTTKAKAGAKTAAQTGDAANAAVPAAAAAAALLAVWFIWKKK